MCHSCDELRELLQHTEADLAAERMRTTALEQRVHELEAQVNTYSDLAALAEERNLLRTLIDSMPDYIFVKDNKHRYLLNNLAHTRAFAQRSPEALVGHTASDFTTPEAVELFHDDDNQVLTTGEPLIDQVETFVGDDGQPLWHSITKVPLHNLKGEIIGVVGISRDITERKRAEQTLEQVLKKERELVNMQARFVSMASHEFRTPLATILSATEMLLRYRARMTPEQLDNRLTEIATQIMFLRDIVENFLHMSRAQTGNIALTRQATDLTTVCLEIIDEFRNRPDVHHKLVLHSTEPPPALLDKQRIRQVILNLVANAIKYSPDDTTIALQLTHTPADLTFSVTDQGIGIPEADQAHLFEMFYRASNASHISGTGLGLAITKEVIELHQGTITCSSTHNRGTTFTVRLPYQMPTPETVTNSA